MKKTILFALFLSQICFGQVKLWNDSGDKIKTKGAFLSLKNESISQNNTIETFFAIPGATVVGTLLPFAFQYGNQALKNLTSNDEKDYGFESISIDNMIIPFEELKKDSIPFSATLNYYPKGKSVASVASIYMFSIKKGGNALMITLDNLNEDYIPVKTKKNYDYVLETFDFTIQAKTSTKVVLEEKPNDTIQRHELLKLGNAKIVRSVASFRKSRDEIINKAVLLFPKYTSKGKNITTDNLIISCKINYLNPYGLTQSSLNRFLENNSDTNESFLNTIFIESED